MANVSDVRGAVGVGTITGTHTARVTTYAHLVGDGTALYIGDIVMAAGGADPLGKYKAVTAITNGSTSIPIGYVVGVDPIEGVAVGSENLNRQYCPASTAMYIRVCDDPEALFYIQEDSVTSNITAAHAGYNIPVNLGSGSTTSGLSGHLVASNTANTTNTFPIKLMGLLDRPDNALGANAKWLCMFNTHKLKVDTGSAGV